MNKTIISKPIHKLIIVIASIIIFPSNSIFAQDGGIGISYTINKPDTTPVNKSILGLSDEQLLSLPGKSIKDNDVKSLINQRAFTWDVVKDTLASENPDIKPGYIIQKTYYNYRHGFEMNINGDTLKRIILYNNYEERPYKVWKRYEGFLPYKLSFDMNRGQVEKLLGKPDALGSKAEKVIYLSRHLIINYFGSDPENAVINSIIIDRK